MKREIIFDKIELFIEKLTNESNFKRWGPS